MAKEPKPTPTSNLYGPSNQAPGKPYVHKFTSPVLTDRILSVRKDFRHGTFVLPEKGDPYEGQDASEFKGFMFATAEPIQGMTGWWNLFYIDERRNQESYNYTIEYPYTDRDYPKIKRTYVLLRGSITEPTANEPDPVFNGTVDPKDPDITTKLGIDPSIALVLTDHKLIRFENDPIIDALFVGVERTYERLPGPVIRTYEENAYQQIVTLDTQEVQPGMKPVADAWTDVAKVERLTTAKQKNTLGTVPDVPRKNIFTQLWASPYRDFLPIPFRYKNPLLTTEYDEAGIAQATDAVLGPIETNRTVSQISEFRRHISTTTAPIHTTILQEQRLTPEQQLETITQTLQPGPQDITPDLGALLLDATVEQVGLGATIKTEKTVDSVFPKAVESSEIPNYIPTEFQASIPTIKETQTLAGLVTIGTPPVLTIGEFAHTETQETEFKKRVEVTRRNLQNLPITITEFRLLEDLREGMSGVLSINKTLDLSGTQTIDQGFLVVTSAVDQLGGGLVVKKTEQIDAWPTLTEVVTDPKTGIVVNITKKMVFPNTPYPGKDGGPGTPFIDIKPIDKWRSIQIVSKVDLHSLPAPLTWATAHRFRLPPILLTVGARWSKTYKSQSKSRSSYTVGDTVENTAQAGVLAHASAGGTIFYTSTAGVEGDVPAEITQTFFYGAPPFSAIPAVQTFETVEGVAYINEQTVTNQEIAGNGGQVGANNDLDVFQESSYNSRERLEIRNVLTGKYTIDGPTSFLASASANAFATDAAGTPYALSQTALASSNLVINLPVSSPPYYVSGQRFIVSVNVERWRFGVFVQDVIAITVPAGL